jgi:Uma2 family endonuclease
MTIYHTTRIKTMDQWEGKWELISGIPFAMAPAPSKKHHYISLQLAIQLTKQLENYNSNCSTYEAVGWQITNDTVVQPDVLVVCGDDIKKIRLEIPPVLIFEILSPSTHHKDRVLKYKLYQEAGVKHYCVIDPETLAAEVFQLNGELYRKEEYFSDGKIPFDIYGNLIERDCSLIFKKLL